MSDHTNDAPMDDSSMGLRRRSLLKMLATAPAAAWLMGGLGAASAQSAAPTIEGKWTGALGGGANQLHVVVSITRSADGSFKGVLDSVDQGATLPIDAITVDGTKIHFEIHSISGVYQGELSADGQTLNGSWTQAAAPNPQPLDFKRQAATAATPAPDAPRRPSLAAPIETFIPKAPTAFEADGSLHLTYEIHVTNFSSQECELSTVEVLAGGANPASIAKYEGADLSGRLGRPGAPSITGLDKLKLGPGMRGVVYMWIDLDAAKPPAALTHRVSVNVAGTQLSTDCAPTDVKQGVAVISPPLRGGEWLAANGPSNISGHRRALIPIGGVARISQRFAIDWVRLNEDGGTFHGDAKDNTNYRAYGSEALAVADGTVTETKDGIPQNIPGEDSRAVAITLETIGGNHVILDIGEGRFAFYAHLQPGSLRVKVGDRVRRGQVVGLVGNTGNSTEPHLHFHISDASSPLGSEGMPYAFEAFELQGKGEDWKPSKAGEPHRMERQIPTENEVIRFS